jgi:hypothetical protein
MRVRLLQPLTAQLKGKLEIGSSPKFRITFADPSFKASSGTTLLPSAGVRPESGEMGGFLFL